MDWKKIEDKLRQRYEGAPEDRRCLATARHVRRHWKKQERHKRLGTSRLSRPDAHAIERQIADIRATWERGRLVLGFDAEWAYDGDRAITEIGCSAFID